MKGYSIAVVAGLLFLAGCSSQPSVEDYQEDTVCVFPDSSEQVEAPKWVCGVLPKDVSVGSVGYAAKSLAGYQTMKNIAVNSARSNLLMQMESKIKYDLNKSTNTNVTEANTETLDKTVKEELNASVNKSISNSKILTSITSPSGGLFVLVGMSEEDFNRQMKN